MPFHQADYELRCEWGLQGLLHLAPISDAVVIVDVLSFSTVVDMVVANGAFVLPYPWKDDSAARFAEEKQAQLACRRRSRDTYSLSPASVQNILAGTAFGTGQHSTTAMSLRILEGITRIRGAHAPSRAALRAPRNVVLEHRGFSARRRKLHARRVRSPNRYSPYCCKRR